MVGNAWAALLLLPNKELGTARGKLLDAGVSLWTKNLSIPKRPQCNQPKKGGLVFQPKNLELDRTQNGKSPTLRSNKHVWKFWSACPPLSH